MIWDHIFLGIDEQGNDEQGSACCIYPLSQDLSMSWPGPLHWLLWLHNKSSYNFLIHYNNTYLLSLLVPVGGSGSGSFMYLLIDATVI